MTGCSSKVSPEAKFSDAAEKKTDSSGIIMGTAQLALKSGDVKNIAFTTVMLTQQDYKVLTDSEQEDVSFEPDTGLDAVRLGIMTTDELDRKTKARFAAIESFQNKLSEKAKMPAIATTTTDAAGNFRFDKVNPGTYWVFLDAKVAINYVGWSLMVEVKPGETNKADMNNSNVDYSFH